MSIGVSMAGARPKGADTRDPLDFEPTPPEATWALVEAERHALAGKRVWEPSCGDGRMVDALLDKGVNVIAASDIADRADGRFQIADFLHCELPEGCDAIATNPPFNLAARFIRRALEHHRVPYLALLLKATFWHAAQRVGLHEQFTPTAYLPLTWRLDFRDQGSAVMECAWFIWDASMIGTQRVQLLPKPAGLFPAPDLFRAAPNV